MTFYSSIEKLLIKTVTGAKSIMRIIRTILQRNWAIPSPVYRTFATVSAKNKPADVENHSFMVNIFRGSLASSQVFPYPDVLTDEQKELTTSLVDPFEKFFLDVNDAVKNDENSSIDDNTLQKLWELGAFGIQVPNQYGGLGLNNTQYARLCEIVGANDLGLGITIGAHQSIGFKGILLFGTDEQKAKFLPKLAEKGVYAAFALTEPSSGSDAASIRSRAVKSTDGKHYILNGSKIWISNGGIAEVMTVFAQTEQLDPQTGEKKDKVTAFIVERSLGGVSSGAPEKKMGIKASNTAEVYFEDVKIPIENILGNEGEGFKIAMAILNNGRFGMSATLAGTMKYCIKKATDHANNRIQFGKKIKDFGLIQQKLAQMNMLLYATESMAYTISQNMDSGSRDYHIEAAISKVFASESAWYVCDEAIQILGGMGFMKEAGLERVLRDLRIFRIFEGTNDILRLFVALTGVQYAGSHLKKIKSSFKNPTANINFIFNELLRRFLYNLNIGKVSLDGFVIADLQPYAAQTAVCIDKFGRKVEELLIKYGNNIVHEQYVLNQLANAAIDIYAMVVTQSRSSRAVHMNLPSAQHEVNLTKALSLQASERCLNCLQNTTSKNHIELSKNMKVVAEHVCENEAVLTKHLLDL